MNILTKMLIFVLLLCALAISAGYITYTYYYEHLVTLARTPEGRVFRQKAEEMGIRTRSKKEKWVDRYDYSIELAQKKKGILVNATYRGTNKLYNGIKKGLNWLNPFKKSSTADATNDTDTN